jgi:hypothetical protein
MGEHRVSKMAQPTVGLAEYTVSYRSPGTPHGSLLIHAHGTLVPIHDNLLVITEWAYDKETAYAPSENPCHEITITGDYENTNELQ